MVIQSDYNYISSKEFNKIISNPYDIFRFGQHDSLELFRILLDHISNEITSNMKILLLLIYFILN